MLVRQHGKLVGPQEVHHLKSESWPSKLAQGHEQDGPYLLLSTSSPTLVAFIAAASGLSALMGL